MPRGGLNVAEFIQHITGVRYRVTGSGNFKTTIFGYDEVTSSELSDIPMSAATNREPTVIANMRDQRMQILFETEEYDEYFVLTRIVVFIKPSATSYPQLI